MLVGCTPTSSLLQLSGQRQLISRIEGAVRASGLTPNLGMKVISLQTGETLYDLNSHHLFTPASTNKLYTAAAALKILTPQYRFTTRVWIDSAWIGRPQVPRLILQGGGDPDLSLQDLEELATAVARMITRVDTLVVDNFLFDSVRQGVGWMWDEGSHWYAAQIDALSLNDNCVDITITPAETGAPPRVEVVPATRYVQIHNTALTVADSNVISTTVVTDTAADSKVVSTTVAGATAADSNSADIVTTYAAGDKAPAIKVTAVDTARAKAPAAYTAVSSAPAVDTDGAYAPTFQELKVERRWWEHSNRIDVTGHLLAGGKSRTFYTNVENPATFTGVVFAEMLSRRGVTVVNPLLVDSLENTPHLLASHTSRPLSAVTLNFLKSSDNLTAELLVKAIGRHQTGQQGSWENGLRAIRTFLKADLGIDTSGMKMVDGAGVSRYNLTSPSQLVQALAYVYHDYTLNAEFMAALPTGGWDGTLRNRLSQQRLQRNIRAKTGTLEGVSCLAGYAYTRTKEPLAFAIMMSGYVEAAEPYRALQDEICYILVNYSR